MLGNIQGQFNSRFWVGKQIFWFPISWMTFKKNSWTTDRMYLRALLIKDWYFLSTIRDVPLKFVETSQRTICYKVVNTWQFKVASTSGKSGNSWKFLEKKPSLDSLKKRTFWYFSWKFMELLGFNRPRFIFCAFLYISNLVS